MRKTVEKVIGEHTYRITQLGADTGDLILFKLGRGLAMEDLSQEDFLFAKNAMRAGTKIGIVDTAEDGRVNFVDLASVYDEVLSDSLEERALWLKEAWEVSFGNFTAALAKLQSARKELLNSVSPKTPAGSSIASSTPSA